MDIKKEEKRLKEEKRVKGILQKIDELPTLPNVISKIMKIIDNPYSNATHLTEVISMDQSLTAKTLKLANSAYYGFPREIVTVTEAVVVLGFLTVRNLILTSTLYNIFIDENIEDNIFDRKRFWKHSIATAICARLIASKKMFSQKDEEEAFTAGILHNIGKVFMDTYMHQEFVYIIKENKKLKEPFYKTEERILGINHAEIGAYIIDKWNLPLNFIEPVKYHHVPEKAKNNKYLTNLIHVANIISKYSVTTYEGEKSLTDVNKTALKELDLNADNILEILKSLEQELSNADLFITD